MANKRQSKAGRRAADRAVLFINQLKHTKGEWYGKSFDLLPWQEQIVREIFGTLKVDGSRQFMAVDTNSNPKLNIKTLDGCICS